MQTYDIPGWKKLEVEFLVFDYNGTLAVDGHLINGVADKLIALAEIFQIHVVTADTFGKAAAELKNLPCTLKILPKARQSEAKREYIRALGAEKTAAVGNGRNDRLMLETAALGIALIQDEGAATATLTAADVVCHSVHDAFNLFLYPKRLSATLRG
jgi:soluble P-type ATPase